MQGTSDRQEAAADWEHAVRHLGPDSPETKEAESVLDRVLRLPDEGPRS